MEREGRPISRHQGRPGVLGKARQSKVLTLDGSEPREGGRVPSSDLEHGSPPVKARRGLHSDAVFKIWDLGKERF